MRTTSILIVAAAVALTGLASRAADAPATHDPKYDPRAAFEQTDTNHDGVVDHEEFQQRLTDVYFGADVNKDGFLDPKELTALSFPEDFTTDDKDKDGRVSMHEFFRVRFRSFEDADLDDDGVLSREEVIAAFEKRKR